MAAVLALYTKASNQTRTPYSLLRLLPRIGLMEAKTKERDHSQLFGVRRSVRYHVHRRRYFEFLTTATTTISFLGASAVGITHYASLPGLEWLPVLFGGLVALVNALSLSIGSSRMANLHADLARQFGELEKRFDPTQPLGDDEYKQRVNERLKIEATVPPTKRLLDVMCHYELMRAMGYSDTHPKIPWCRRALAHVFSQPTYAVSLGNK